MKRDNKSRAHNNNHQSGNNSRSSTPNNIILSKDFVNYSSATLSSLHYSFGSSAYVLHDALYFSILIVTTIVSLGQMFLLYGEALTMWHTSYAIASLVTILFVLQRGVVIQTVKESMSIKALWLWIGANVIIVITFVVALSSSTYPFTMWTLHNWVLMWFIINMPMVLQKLTSVPQLQCYFPISKSEEASPSLNNVSSLILAGHSFLSWQHLLFIPHDNVVRETKDVAPLSTVSKEETTIKNESVDMEKFNIKQELLTFEHIQARFVCFIIFIFSIVAQCFGVVFLAVSGPLLLTSLGRNNKLLYSTGDCWGLVAVGFIAIPSMILSHALQICRVPLKRYLDYLQFLLMSYENSLVDHQDMHVLAMTIMKQILRGFMILTILEFRSMSSLGQQFSVSILSTFASLIIAMLITFGISITFGSWRFQIVSIPLAVTLIFSFLLIGKFGTEDFSRHKHSNNIIPRDVTSQSQQIDDDIHAQKTAARILTEDALIAKVGTYNQLCTVFNESVFAQSELLQVQIPSDVSSPVAPSRSNTNKGDRKRDQLRRSAR